VSFNEERGIVINASFYLGYSGDQYLSV